MDVDQYPDPQQSPVHPYPIIGTHGHETPEVNPEILYDDNRPSTQSLEEIPATTEDEDDSEDPDIDTPTRPYTSSTKSGQGPDRSWDPSFELGEDDDELDDVISADEDSESAAENGSSSRGLRSGRGSGRGRGAGRGRRGWKWALKGTAHDPALDKPKPTPRKRGPKRGSGRMRARAKYKAAGGEGRVRFIKGTDKIEPGSQYRMLQGKANTAFMEGKLDDALGYAREAVSAFPDEPAAHSLISQIFEARGEHEEAITALMESASKRGDASLVAMCCERALHHYGANPPAEKLKWLSECYTKALKYDPKNYEVRVGHLQLQMRMKDWSSAERTCRAILKSNPHDLSSIRSFAEVVSQNMGPDSYRQDEVMKAYTAAFDHLIATEDYEGTDFDELWSHLNVLMDLMDQRSDPSDSLHRLKRYARSLLGRGDEQFWELHTKDDREFDNTHNRRVYVGEFQQGNASRDLEQYGDGLPMEIRMKMGFLRLKMGEDSFDEALIHLDTIYHLREYIDEYFDYLCDAGDRLKAAGLNEQALKFYEPCMGVPDLLGPAFWMGAATCYHRLRRWEQAEQCYDQVLSQQRSNSSAMAGLANIYELTGRLDEARVLAGTVLALGHGNENILRLATRKIKPLSARRLAPKPSTTARISLEDGADSGGSTPRSRKKSAPEGPTRGKRNRPNRPTATEIVRSMDEQRDRILNHYSALSQSWPDLEPQTRSADVDLWMNHADQLCRDFADTRVFFTRMKFTGYGRSYQEDDSLMKEMVALKARLGDGDPATDDGSDDTAPQHFHYIPFGEWHRLFITLAILYAQQGHKDRCYELLDVARNANVFSFNKNFSETTTNARIHVALIFNDDETLIQISRDFVLLSHGTGAEAYQFFSAINRLGHNNLDFRDGTTQKFFLRQIKSLDWPHLPPSIREVTDQWGSQGEVTNQKFAKIEKTGFTSHRLLPGALLTYGNIIGQAAYTYCSLVYSFRALALLPDNVCINLHIAVQLIQSVLRRGSEHKRYEITLGLAFLQRYYELRTASGDVSHLQEAEFNVGRCWHMLGLTHLAIEPYERALALSEQVQKGRSEARVNDGQTDDVDMVDDAGNAEQQVRVNGLETEQLKADEVEDFATEAAWGLRQILTMAGNNHAAAELTQKYLVI